MTRAVRAGSRSLALLCSCALSACATRPLRAPAIDPGGCPAELHRAIAISAAVVPIQPPRAVRVPSGPVPLIAATGRRLMLAVRISAPVPRMRLLSNSLELLTYGGTLGGWARLSAPAGAAARQSLAIQGGWLQIAPFVPGAQLHSRTEVVDLLVVPGGGPRAALAVRPGPLWDARGRPLAPRSLRLRFAPELHMTRLHSVDATATFRFTALHLSAAHERWHCSIAENFTLVDHDARLAALWVLRFEPENGAAPQTLALYSARRGAFQAIFRNPQTARAFAQWLSQRHARHAGPYDLGLLDATGAHFLSIRPGAFGHLRVARWSGP